MQRPGETRSSPFAQLPAVRGKLARHAPEIVAASTYIAFLLVGGSLRVTTGAPILTGAAWAYLLGSLLLIVVPTAMAASRLAGERDQGTLDALLLTKAKRRPLVWGMYRNLLLPWLRSILWLFPLYLLLVFGQPEPRFAYWDGGLHQTTSAVACAVSPRPLLAALVIRVDWPRFGVSVGVMVAAVRLIRDSVTLMLAVSMALFISARCGSALKAMMLSLVLVPLLLGTVFSWPEWASLFMTDSGTKLDIYFWSSAANVAVEGVVAVNLIRHIARNFDRYLLRAESPG